MTDETGTDLSTEEQAKEMKKEQAKLVAGKKGYIVPTTVEEASRMAKAVIVGNLCPDSYKDNGVPDQGKVLLGIMAALEAGLPPLYGLRQIAIINGRPVIWGDAALALVQSRDVIDEYHEEQIGTLPEDGAPIGQWPEDYGWKVTMKRRGQKGEYVGTFTVADAKRANLWMHAKKKPWLEHPNRMMKIRARTFPLRDGFADALAGLGIREEVEDYIDVEAKKKPEVSLDDTPMIEAPPMDIEESVNIGLEETPELVAEQDDDTDAPPEAML